MKVDAAASSWHVREWLFHLQLPQMLSRFPERWVWAAFVFINGFVMVALLAAAAIVTGTPLVFPSLGPTAILFFVTPLSPTASPKNSVIGHAIGIVCGYASLALFGLRHAPPAVIEGFHLPRLLAASLSLAATGALMILCRAAHPPAGATTLIISLGVITRPEHLLCMEIAVAALAAQAFLINRLAGVPYPAWKTRGRPHLDPPYRMGQDQVCSVCDPALERRSREW